MTVLKKIVDEVCMVQDGTITREFCICLITKAYIRGRAYEYLKLLKEKPLKDLQKEDEQ